MDRSCPFKFGDLLKIKTTHHQFPGYIATFLHRISPSLYEVEVKNTKEGHNGSGIGKPNQCWYLFSGGVDLSFNSELFNQTPQQIIQNKIKKLESRHISL